MHNQVKSFTKPLFLSTSRKALLTLTTCNYIGFCVAGSITLSPLSCDNDAQLSYVGMSGTPSTSITLLSYNQYENIDRINFVSQVQAREYIDPDFALPEYCYEIQKPKTSWLQSLLNNPLDALKNKIVSSLVQTKDWLHSEIRYIPAHGSSHKKVKLIVSQDIEDNQFIHLSLNQVFNLGKKFFRECINNPGKTFTLVLASQAAFARGQSISFTQRTGSANPFNGINCGTSYGGAALGDLNSDGYVDLLCVGGATGNFRYYVNNGAGAFTQTTIPSGLSSVQGDVPIIADFNGDGKPDIAVGHYSGNSVYDQLFYFLNTGTSTNPAFTSQGSSSNPFYGFTYNSVSVPGLYLNNGLINVVVGDSSSNPPVYLQNIGTATNPKFSKQIGVSNPFDITGSWDSNTFKAISTNSFIVGNGNTITLAFETFSGTTVRTAQRNSDGNFSDITGTANDPFNGITIGSFGYVRSSIGDVNQDGNPDIIFQDNGGTLYYFENTTPVVAITSALLTTQDMTTQGMTSSPSTTNLLTSASQTTNSLTTSPLTSAELTTNEMTTAGVTTSALTTNAVTSAELTSSALTSAILTTTGLITSPLITSPVTSSEVASSQLTTDPATTQFITSAQLTTDQLTTSSRTTSLLTTNSITSQKLITQALTTASLTTDIVTNQALTTKTIMSKNLGDEENDDPRRNKLIIASTVGSVGGFTLISGIVSTLIYKFLKKKNRELNNGNIEMQ